MKLKNVDRASQLVNDVLADSGTDSLVYLSVMVTPTHKRLITGLAKLNRAKQAHIVRSLIDDWCERQMENEVVEAE